MQTVPSSLFSSIPHVVGDTRALIAYIVAAIGRAAVALKVQRNRNLLYHLRKLPESDRLKALQMEMGAVPLPSEMTPTEYLRARAHTYYFWAFVILCVLLGAIGALAISYRRHDAGEISKGFEDALAEDRKRQAASADDVRVQQEQTKIEALRLRRIPGFYIQEFGQPSDRGTHNGVTYVVWQNDLYELDMSFEDGLSADYCVISESAKFKPAIPGSDGQGDEGLRLGDKALAQLGDSYLYDNHGSAGGSTVIRYGLSGSNADDNLFGFVADVDSRSEYPEIPGANQLPELKPASVLSQRYLLKVGG